MSQSLLDIHDGLLLQAPEGSRHDASLCPFCTDWSMSESGTPSGFDRLDLADKKAPYGNVEYADPGYQKDGVKRYPIDTEAHARAAWSYIHQASNAAKYSADDLSKIRVKIQNALKKFGVDAEEKNEKDESQLTDAKRSTSTNKIDAASEGGKQKHMDNDTQETISKETHQALLDKALRDSTASLTAERDALKASVDSLTSEKASLEGDLTGLRAENERLNGELDTAQVALKAAQDEASTLKADLASRDEAARKAEIASDRAAQVRNLQLFPEEYINDKASKWAEVDEAAWNDRLDEWKALKGTSTNPTSTTDVASAMTGTRGGGTGHESSARRAILGLA